MIQHVTVSTVALLLVQLLGAPVAAQQVDIAAMPTESDSTLAGRLPRVDLSEMDPVLGEWFERSRQTALELLAREDVEDARQAAAVGSLGMTYAAFDLYEPALVCFELARELSPQEPRWHYLAAAVAPTVGRPDLERSALERAVELAPDLLPAVVALADAYLSAGELDEAGSLYQHALELEGGKAIGYFGLGRVAALAGDAAAAAEHFRRVLELQPEATAVHYPLARTLMKLGRMEEARRHLAKRGETRATYPNTLGDQIADVKALVSFQVVYGMTAPGEAQAPERILDFARAYLGSLQGSVEAMEKVLARPETAELPVQRRALLHYVTGGLAAHQGLAQKALEHLREAVRLDPELTVARVHLGSQLALVGDLEGAREELAIAAEQRPGDATIRLRLASVEMNLGEAAAATANLDRVLVAQPQNLEALILRAQVAELAGDQATADERFKALSEADLPPDDEARVYAAWAEIFRMRGAYAKAAERLRQALRLKTTTQNPRVRLRLARLLGTLGRFQAAEEEYRRVLESQPDNLEAAEGAASVLVLQEKYVAAVELLAEEVETHPEAPRIRLLLVRLLAAAPDSAVRDAARALELTAELPAGDDVPLAVADTVAMAHAAAGDFAQAAALLADAMLMSRYDHPTLRQRLALYRQAQPFVAETPQQLLVPH